ncbi:helix-turn-helix transcriptional regulator [Leptolyngbyaceae cyanobacterium UHCC 1019]
MTLTFTQSDWNDLWESTTSATYGFDDFETLSSLPSRLGNGCSRAIDLAPGLFLSLTDWQCERDWVVQVAAHDHPIQLGVFLSGVLDAKGAHPTLGNGRAYFSGSGISPSYAEHWYGGQRMLVVNVELEPERLDQWLGEEQVQSITRSLLCKGQDWKASFYPKQTNAMRSLALQIWNPPYQGAARRMYLQAKVWELLAMQIDLLTADQAGNLSTPKLKPDTIARLHYAREILTQNLEHSPLLSEVARQVGVSERTLRRGFQVLFGLTPLEYLTRQRLHRAQELLQTGECTVTEVARTVGYAHLGHFADTFKRQFGITPGACVGRN